MPRFAQFAKASRKVPVLRQALEYAYLRRFNSCKRPVRMFRGIYPDFASATSAIPTFGLQGYDNEESATRLADERLRICPFDYPVMFWLARLLPHCKLLFDWGGHVGISYFGYRKYLSYPSGMTWLVNDVPAVAALGEQIASQNSATDLQFTTTLDRLSEADTLLAAGSLTFIDDPFALLRTVARMPAHVLINKLPAYGLPSAVTLHNMGSAFCPYQLFNRDEFVGNFDALGYRLIDEWKSPDLGCEIPFHPEHSISAYTGFYFTKQAPE